ncbi:MAG TPA: hypothetical protein VM243_11960 [Phycisphaerae bacterium]|nr:hypothetical protein [Phycisphaerae bacterium]
MSRDEAPQLARGTTWYKGDAVPATLAERGYQNLLGKTWVFEDVSPTTGVARTNRYVTLRLVYNSTTWTIYPKQLCQIDQNDPGKVIGTVIATNDGGLPADEYLPAAGVPAGDAFYVVERGPAMIRNSVAEIAENIIAVNDWIVGATIDATSGAGDTTGRIGKAAFAITSQATDLATVLKGIQNCVGKAMSAAVTSGVTDTDVLVDVGAGVGL